MKQKQKPQPAFKVGDFVKLKSLRHFKQEVENWSPYDKLELGRSYKVREIASDRWLYLDGKKFGHFYGKFILTTESKLKRAILRKSVDGTFFYSLYHGNTKCIGTNRGINRKQDALDALANSFGDFEVIDETKKK